MSAQVDNKSPEATYTFDLKQNTIFERDNQNFINEVSIDQLNTLENISILSIYLSKGKIVEPHYHQRATELIYCVTGGVTVSIVNPFTNELHSYPITAGEVVNVPQGWWHYIVSDADHTNILGIFNAPRPEVILGSSLFNSTPPSIVAKTYCVNEAEWEKLTSPIPPSLFIGPPKNCHSNHKEKSGSYEPQWHPYSYCTKP